MAQTRRAQILMDPAEYSALQLIARQRRTSVGDLIRLAVREKYLTATDERRAAAARIAGMSLPVESWEQMKQEIEGAYDAGLP